MREPNEQKTIGIVEVRSLRCPPAKHIDLLPQDQDFCCQLCSRLEERSQDAENQLERIGHQAVNLPRPLPASMPNLIFGTHPPDEKEPFTAPHVLSLSSNKGRAPMRGFEEGRLDTIYLPRRVSFRPPTAF